MCIFFAWSDAQLCKIPEQAGFSYPHDHQTRSLRPYVLYFLTCHLSTWLAFHLCQNWILDTPKLPDLYFLISQFVILLSHLGWTLGFYFFSFPIWPLHLSVVQLLLILSLQYLLFNLFHFILTTTAFYVLFSLQKFSNLWSQDQRFILIKIIENSKELLFMCYSYLYLMHSKSKL